MSLINAHPSKVQGSLDYEYTLTSYCHPVISCFGPLGFIARIKARVSSYDWLVHICCNLKLLTPKGLRSIFCLF